MERMCSLILLEIKKKKFMKSLLISMLGMILLLMFFTGINKSIDSSRIVLSTIPYLILANGCFCLTQDFSNKTDRIIFTGVFKKWEILVSKLISLFFIGLSYIVFYEIVLVLYNLYINKDISSIISFSGILNNIYTVLIYTFTLGSFMLMVSVCIKNTIFTGIITYVCFFNLTLVVFSQILSSNKGEVLKSIIRNSPFYILNTGFNSFKYSFNQSVIMVISGIIFLALACVIINRKNI